MVAGPQYPQDIVWPANVERIEHLPPCEHATFYSASRLTLNVTRADMIEVGWSPSVRLFEAAACGTAIVSDIWEGLAAIFEPGREILLARGSPDIASALERDDLFAIGQAARDRVLGSHVSRRRCLELEAHLIEARHS